MPPSHSHSHSHALPGRFIVLEGIDGSGSTTHTKLLSKALRKQGHDVRTSCEPTNGPVGSLIRQVLQRRLLVSDGDTVRPFAWSTMALLFAADRLDHLDSFVLPGLEDGAIVISDRYDLSSLAYQSATAPGGAEVLPWIRQLNARALRPDLTVVLDVTAEVAEERRERRGGAEELFEKREIQAKLARLYLEAEALVPGDKLVHVPGDASVEETAARIQEVVLKELGL